MSTPQTDLAPQQPDRDFTHLTPWLGTGAKRPQGWHALTDLPLTIVVGVTGVGKSTTLAALTPAAGTVRLLPNRRSLTDDLIIARLQHEDGMPFAPVTDRTARFGYTRRYRIRYPGGMAHALAQLSLTLADTHTCLLFDGLRGVDEVTAAVDLFPQANFAVLTAPDAVRVLRLLGRRDAFDRVTLPPEQDRKALPTGEIATLADFLGPAEQEALLALVARGEVHAGDLLAKLQIVATERRQYDPHAALHLLQTRAPDRTITIDTSRCTPQDAAREMMPLLRPAQPE